MVFIPVSYSILVIISDLAATAKKEGRADDGEGKAEGRPGRADDGEAGRWRRGRADAEADAEADGASPRTKGLTESGKKTIFVF